MSARLSVPSGVPASPRPMPNPLFEETLEGIRDLALYYLGDSTNTIWSNDEVDRYVVEGYQIACFQILPLWDMAYLDCESGTALYEQPSDCYKVERATWNWKLIIPLFSTDLERQDPRYQFTQGEVMAFTQDKDHLNWLRLVRVPASDSDKYTATGTYGLLRTYTGISDTLPVQPYGICRRMVGMHPTGFSYPYGFSRRFIKDENNVRLEYYRRPRPDIFELPLRFTKHLRAYALWHALEREGDGQNMKLAAYWQRRWTIGLQRASRTKSMLTTNRVGVLGGGVPIKRKPPRPQLPWEYGRVIR